MLYLRQNDPLWGSLKLGASKLTVAGWGCTTTAISMLSDYFGDYASPAVLAINKKLYTKDGLILWGELRRAFSKFKWVTRQYGCNRALIDESLRDPNKAVILEVPLGKGKHWVTAIRKNLLGFGSDYIAIDPLTGGKINVLAKYKRITGSSHFERV